MSCRDSHRALACALLVFTGCASMFNCSSGNGSPDANRPGDAAAGAGGVAGSGGRGGSPADASIEAGPDACSAPAGAAGEPCGCGACAGGAVCVSACAVGGGSRNVCTAPAAQVGTCVCGVVLDDRCTGGASCICPVSCDGIALCLTAAQRAVLCAGPYAANFSCP
jgi:hypothetical protein